MYNKEKNNILYLKSFEFALRIIKLSKYLKSKQKEYTISKQVLRSGTSIGANIKESMFAQSKKDFTSKLSISLKEASETEYWLELLKSEYLKDELVDDLMFDLKQIMKLLISSIKTSKLNS